MRLNVEKIWFRFQFVPSSEVASSVCYARLLIALRGIHKQLCYKSGSSVFSLKMHKH